MGFFTKKKRDQMKGADTAYPTQEGNGKKGAKLSAMAKRSKGKVSMSGNDYYKEKA